MNLLVFACSKSLNENLSYGIYYDPTTRNHRPFTHIGFYNKQAIVGIGQLHKIVACDLLNGQLQIQPGWAQTLTVSEKTRVADTIKISKYDIAKGYKFILVNDVSHTNFVKGSPGPLRWKQYVDLLKYPNVKATDSTITIAQKLRNQTW